MTRLQWCAQQPRCRWAVINASEAEVPLPACHCRAKTNLQCFSPLSLAAQLSSTSQNVLSDGAARQICASIPQDLSAGDPACTGSWPMNTLEISVRLTHVTESAESCTGDQRPQLWSSSCKPLCSSMTCVAVGPSPACHSRAGTGLQ